MRAEPPSAEVLQVAWPALTLALAQPGMSVPPSWNSTVPVAPDGEIVAVKVTEFPTMDGFSDEPRPVVVLVCRFVNEKLRLFAPAALAVTV